MRYVWHGRISSIHARDVDLTDLTRRGPAYVRGYEDVTITLEDGQDITVQWGQDVPELRQKVTVTIETEEA